MTEGKKREKKRERDSSVNKYIYTEPVTITGNTAG